MKITTYFKEVKSEMSKVIWPTRAEVIRSTTFVIVFSLAVALLLWGTDQGIETGLAKLISLTH